MPTYVVNDTPTRVDNGASTAVAVTNTGSKPVIVQPSGRRLGPGEAFTFIGWSATPTTVTAPGGQVSTVDVTLTAGSPAAGPGPGALVVDPNGRSMTVTVSGATLYSDEALLTAVSFPRTITGRTSYYAAAPASVTAVATLGGVQVGPTFGTRLQGPSTVEWKPGDFSGFDVGPGDIDPSIPASDIGTYAPKPVGTPTVGQVPVVTTVSPLALGWGAGGGGVNNITGLDLTHLGKWVRAKARVYAGTQDAKILCIGDSGTEGAGSSTIATYPERSAWPARLASILTASGLPAASGLGVPRYNTILQADNRWTIGTGWTPAGGFGMLNACAYQGNSPAGALVYADPTILADSFDVYYLTNPGLGTLNITATGSSVVNQSANAAGSVQKVTVTAASAATTNTVSISATGNTYVVGVEPFLSTTKKVRIGNVGAGGTTAAAWALATGGTFAGDKVIQAYAPDLTFIGLGLNDATGAASTATVMANLTTLRGFVTTGDVAFLTWIPSNDGARTPSEPGYVAGISATFGPTNAVFDYYTRVASYSNALALGLSAGDNLHPSDLGYWDIGQWVGQGLMSV